MATGGLSAQGLFAIDVTCGLLSFLFISIHIYGRHCFLGKLFPYASDIFLVASWIGYLISQIILDYFVMKWGFNNPNIIVKTEGSVVILPQYELFVDPENLQAGLKVAYIVISLYHLQMFFVKMVFLLTYRRLFPETMPKLRTALNITTAALVVGYSIIVAMFLGWCQPISSNWAKHYTARCLTNSSFIPYLFSLIFHIVSDIAIYALPFFILRKISYKSCLSKGEITYVGRRPLWPVYVIFSLGMVCILIAVARGIVPGTESSGIIITAFQDAEVASAQILACLPMARKVLQRAMVWVRSRRLNMIASRPESHLSNGKLSLKTTVDATSPTPDRV